MRVLSTIPNIEEGKRGTRNRSHARPLPPPLRVGELYPLGANKKTCKDMLTMCRAVALAVSRAHDAGADDAPDNAPHDPARDAKPSGKLRCKNAGTNVHAGLGNVRNNPAVHTVALNHLPSRMLGAGPRATTPPQLTPFAARAAAADTAAPAHAAAPDLGRSRDTAGLT